jgi:two-component SAPR family response regulator
MRVSMCAVGQLYAASPEASDSQEPVRAQLKLLGPLRLMSDELDEPVNAAPKIRTVLAMLCMHPNQAVRVSVLTRELWSEQPPVTASRTLQTYILNIRKLLSKATGLKSAEIADQMLVTQDNGYSLRSSDLRLDWLVPARAGCVPRALAWRPSCPTARGPDAAGYGPS